MSIPSIANDRADYSMKNKKDPYKRDDLWDSIKSAPFSTILLVISEFPEIEETLKDFLIEFFDSDAGVFVKRLGEVRGESEIHDSASGTLYNSLVDFVNESSDANVLELCKANGIDIMDTDYDKREELVNKLFEDKLEDKKTTSIDKMTKLELMAELKKYGISIKKEDGTKRTVSEVRQILKDKLLSGGSNGDLLKSLTLKQKKALWEKVKTTDQKYSITKLRKIAKQDASKIEHALMKTQPPALKHPPVRRMEPEVSELIPLMEQLANASEIYREITSPNESDRELYFKILQHTATPVNHWILKKRALLHGVESESESDKESEPEASPPKPVPAWRKALYEKAYGKEKLDALIQKRNAMRSESKPSTTAVDAVREYVNKKGKRVILAD